MAAPNDKKPKQQKSDAENRIVGEILKSVKQRERASYDSKDDFNFPEPRTMTSEKLATFYVRTNKIFDNNDRGDELRVSKYFNFTCVGDTSFWRNIFQQNRRTEVLAFKYV